MVDEVLNVRGLADLNAALNDLAVALARNVLRGAVRAGAEVIRKEAVTRAPVYAPPGAPDQRVDPGLIKRSIFSAHVPNQSDDTKQVFIVGVRSGRRERHAKVRAHGGGSQVMNRDAYYAAWVEFGHWYVPAAPDNLILRARRNRARRPGGVFVPAKPFMRPAFEAKKREAVDAMERYLKKRLAKERRNLQQAVAGMKASTNADDSGTTGLAA